MSVMSRASALQFFEDGVIVRQIAEYDLITVAPSDDCESALAVLEEHGLDRAPVADPEGIYRTVSTDALAAGGTVDAVAVPITANETVGEKTGVGSLLPRFIDRDHFYVLGRTGIEAVVTRADLQRPPVSMAVLGIILSLETALTDLINTYSHGSWLTLLPSDRAGGLEERFEQNRERNVELTRLDCLDLVDRFELVRCLDPLRSDLGFTSKSAVDKQKRSIIGLRNPLAHGRSPFADGADVVESLRVLAQVRNLSERAWQLHADSDFVWDAYLNSRLDDAAGQPVTAPASGEPPTFVLTAYNPNGSQLNDERNTTANERLGTAIRELGGDICPAVSRSPSGEWAEPSFLTIGITREQALELADRYGQKAIFELDDQHVRVIEVSTGTEKRSRPW